MMRIIIIFREQKSSRNEIASIARSYKKQLADSGLSLNKDGTISADKEVIINALITKTPLSHIYESLNSFKNSIKEKAEDIALNPMDYVNKIIAYKNPLRSFPDLYNPFSTIPE